MKYTNVKRLDGVGVISPKGNLTGGEETDELRDVIDELDKEGVNCLVVNLAGTTFINSTGLSTLIGAHVKFSKRGAKVNLCYVDHKVNQIFVITKLTMIFDAYENEEQAIAGCAGGKGPSTEA